MHGKKLLSLFLLTVLTAGAFAEKPNKSIDKSQSAPAREEDLTQKSLADVCQAIDAKDWPRAKKILTAILPEYRQDPKYYLAYGCVYIGSGHDAPAATALKRAVSLDEKLGPAYGALALYYLRTDQHDQAAQAFAKAEMELGSDRAYIYSRAIGYGMVGDWKKAEDVFEKLSKVAEDEQPDDVAISAGERLKEINVFNKNIQPMIDRQENDLADEYAQRKQLEQEGEKYKQKLLDAEDEKNLLQDDYDADYEAIEDAYEEAKDRIEDQYDRDRPAQELASSDPPAYARYEYNANKVRSDALRRVKRLRDAAFAKLKRKVAPDVRKIKQRISLAKRELESLEKDIKVKDKDIKKLELALEKYKDQHRPFDTEKYSRDATIQLTRKAILESARPSTQPTTQPD